MDEDDGPPAKRLKTNACLRCRKRKQRCDNQRPCANCSRSKQQCIEPPPSTDCQSHGYVSHNPLGRLADIASLEERISRLEDDHFRQGHGSQRNHSTPPISRVWSTELPPLDQVVSNSHCDRGFNPPGATPEDPSDQLSDTTKTALFSLYIEKVQSRYPFLRIEHVQSGRGLGHVFFRNVIFSIALLLGGRGHGHLSTCDQQVFYDAALKHHLPAILAQSDRLLHIQSHLLLSMHALFSPSTERIISSASTTMRSCVMAQLHLADAEPHALNAATKVDIQIRRRIFWSAYALDRTVGATLDLPFCIPDSQITVKLFANINDTELEARCLSAFPQDAPSLPGVTNVSAALHVVYCRQIQSEILNTTLHRDFWTSMDTHHRWRLRVIEKLDKWRSLCHRYADKRVINFSNSEWLHMIYNYSLAMLYQPTKMTASESAGDWTVKACTQALLIFRKFQRERPLTDLWLGLIAQFKCGVALLYCFFATSPQQRSSTFESLDVSEAVRACSVTLSLLAERWPESKCVRDCFDILAREIPLFEHSSSSVTVTSKHRMRSESSDALEKLMSQLEILVVHRGTLRMVREMMTDDFPGVAFEQVNENTEDGVEEPVSAEAIGDFHSRCSGMTEDFFQPFTRQYMVLDSLTDPAGQFDESSIWFPGDFDLDGTF